MEKPNIELAIVRHAVVSQRWSEISSDHYPDITAFLAGWCLRCIDAPEPTNVGRLKDSFRAGWVEADGFCKSYKQTKFMAENGLGAEDMENDLTYPPFE